MTPPVSGDGRGPDALSRFGQLTYTSFDPPAASRTGSGGGWQVKDVAGGLTRHEQEAMRAWVSTRFDLVRPLPQFPTPTDIRNRPRRLMYARMPGGAAGYWHTVPAGADASGRPGNVFAHVVVDRAEVLDREGDGALRPIELWRSADWLAPYGAREVAQAILSRNDGPRPGGAVDRAAVLRFLLDPGTWRIGVLSVLLDALARAMTGGPAIVLGVRDPDSAAMWIGAVSHFMSPGTARRFGWCTFERRHAVDETITRGVHLVAVPGDDVEDIPDAAGYVPITEDETPDLGELGVEPHHTQRGAVVPVTPWSVLAQTVLLDEECAVRALTRQDAIAARVGDSELSPMWPLAMAVASDPELHDALPEATLVIAEHSPESLRRCPDLMRVAAVAFGPGRGSTTEDAWRDLERFGGTDTNGLSQELAWTTFLSRALADPFWFRRSGASYPPEFARTVGWAPAELQDAAEHAVRALVDRARTAPPQSHDVDRIAVEAVRTLDLLAHAGLTAGRTDDLLSELLERTVVPILCDRARGPRLVRLLGEVGNRTRTQYIQGALASYAPMTWSPLGRRLPRTVVEWVVGEAEKVPSISKLTRDPRQIATPLCLLVAELAFQIFGAGQSREKRAWAAMAPLALWRALFEAEQGGWYRTDISPLFSGPRWTARDLHRVVDAFPDALPVRFLGDAIIHAPWDPDVEAVVARVVERASAPADPHLDGVVASWAVVRSWERWDEFTGPYLEWFLEAHVWPVLADYSTRPEADLPPDLLVWLAIFYIALRSKRLEAPRLPQLHEDLLVASVLDHASTVVDAVTAMVKSAAVDVEWIVVTAVFTSPAAPRVRSVMDRDDPLARMTVDVDGWRCSILEQVAVAAMADVDYRGPIGAHGLLDAMWTELTRRGIADPGCAYDAYSGFAWRWIEERRGDVN